MSISLPQILSLVGKLDDSPGEDSARERFRHFLKENIKEVGQIRDYIEECLRSTGDQYNRGLQDLINYLGSFLEFEVTFGRYKGVQNQIGFDGHWCSPTGFHLVVEVKTTETYAVNTAILVGYVDELISTKSIPSWNQALGLYVIGRPDPHIRQLENAIIVENRTHQLRLISAESLISLAEMMTGYDIGHDDILEVIRPSGPQIDPVVNLMSRLMAQRPVEDSISDHEPAQEEVNKEEKEKGKAVEEETAYWLTPVKSDEEQTAEEVIRILVGEERIYAFGDRTPGRKHIKIGDWICFYASAKGIIGHAEVQTKPEKQKNPKVRHNDMYPWIFNLKNSKLYLDDPIVIDTDLRGRLDAFKGRDPDKHWAWFVQATNKISKHDFEVLTQK